MTLGSNADARTRGLIVSALTMARDLEAFRARGVVSSAVTLADLACAQKVLAAVADALVTGDDAARDCLHRAAEGLPAAEALPAAEGLPAVAPTARPTRRSTAPRKPGHTWLAAMCPRL